MNAVVKRTPAEWKSFFESEEFVENFTYEGDDLGVSVRKSRECDENWQMPKKDEQFVTEWKLWAPTVMEVSLELFSCGSSRERGDRKIASIAMTRGEKGVWSCAMQGAWYGTYYTYHILHSDGVFDTTDPYGVASGIDSERSMVVNLAETDPAGWEQDERPEIRPEDRCVYELHVKDFSSDPHSGISDKHRGKFLAFTEEGTTLNGDGFMRRGSIT